ncbi:hypothetical protein G5B37_02275 [Rasiella rasia]|uniref:Putative beta-lactamase-inhibitor-like PepSY-like domain-containing protein n=1 Tax=Rasiella rasia TaxID=2744027 RepID=A0A6G6GIV4_9FLAO|nr:PepSY-like domain-containing protein [Rasiella rasia]QIE58430.1 hypothetical protein G5B37_02275 [Rasiella rasia]
MTKQLYFLIAILVSTAGSCQNIDGKKGQKDIEVPKVVLAAFEEKYPQEKSPKWEIDAHGNYEAHFKKKGEKYRADFSPNGPWIETENSIKTKNLPDPIKKIISERYFLYEITEVEHVDHATKGIFYDVEFKQKGKNLDIEFTEDGTILN